MLRAVAHFSVRHRWLVVLGWLVVVVAALAVRQGAGGHFSNDLSVPGTDSDRALTVLHEKFPTQSGDAMQVVVHAPDGVRDPAVRAAVTDALTQIGSGPDVVGTVSPYGPGGLVSADGTTAVAMVQFAERAKDIPPASVDAAQSAAAPMRAAGAQVEFGGAAVQAEPHPNGGELLGLLAAVVVLLFVFGSVFAMVVPLLTALFAIGLGLSLVSLLATVMPVGTAAPVVAAMIGLGVGIDYALLIVTRHREGMTAGRPPAESIAIAMATAGRSVLVAGSTVIVAILSLYLIGIRFVSTLGLASAITVATTLLAATTLLPALLAIFGTRLDRYRVRRIASDSSDGRASAWHRWTRRIQRRPWPYLTGAIVALVAVALPVFSLRLGSADAGANPTSETSRRAYDLVARDFGPGWTGPLLVTVDFHDGLDAARRDTVMTELRATLVATPSVATVTPPRLSSDGDAGLLTVVPTSSPQDSQTETLVHELRDTLPAAYHAEDVDVHVGGQTAMAIDLADRLAARMPWFIGFVVGLSLLLLLVEFRSVFVPVKAAAMNLLSVAAAYGAVVAAFQWGWLPGAHAGPIESFAPMMLFAVLFGLSMDYEVFLLSRVREEYLASGDARRAVADGIAATARVITAAAAVMVVVFASFLLNEQRVVNLFGFGLAIAVALDATIVRLVLVPAAMSIAGKRAWSMPPWLDRVLPRIGGITDHPQGGAMPVYRSWTDTVRFSPDGPTPTVLQHTDELKVVLVGLEPGQELPEHPAPAASFHVLEGTGVITVDGTPTEVGPGATIVVPSGATRGWRANHRRLVFLGSLGTPDRDDAHSPGHAVTGR